MAPKYGRAIGDPSDDDYVAQLLAKEARDSSAKYSAEGLGAYVPKRPTGAAPKPNTRFLRHIIKETDSHNAALKRKEEKEARERMRQLRDQATSSSSRDTRRHRQPVFDDREPKRERREDREDRHRSHRRRHRSRSASGDRESSGKSRRKRDGYDTDEDRHKSSRRERERRRDDHERTTRRRRRSYSRSRSRSPRHERSYESRRSRKYKDEDTRGSSHRSRDHRSSRRESPSRKASPPPTTLQDRPSEDESDPLEDLIGPLPDGQDAALRTRGRGAYRPNLNNIDAHFAADYDPTLDVRPEEDESHTGTKSTRRPVPGLMTGDDDWELALEAVRDRARWRQKGEERLRQAGFNEDTVERWKSNPAFATPGDTEGRPEDVKWSKKGEGREWDRGKFVDDDGHIDVKASW